MEYIAYIFLGLGILLTAAGFVNHPKKDSAPSAFPLAKKPAENAGMQSAPRLSAQPPYIPPSPSFSPSAPAPAPTPEPPRIGPEFKVISQNPDLIRKEGHLYLDHSGRNFYGMANNAIVEHPDTLSGIRRIGIGHLSYDGFSFRFQSGTAQESFPVSFLSQIAFYPNCIVFTRKDTGVSALFFVDESESIRRVLETFQAQHGNSI